jgi:diacylglycerol kinase family enzyme
MLEVMVLESVSKLAFLTRILPNVFSGKHVEQPSVSVFRARSVSITCERPFTMYADGDPIGDLPVTVSALQAAVRMLVPLVGPDDPAFGSEG